MTEIKNFTQSVFLAKDKVNVGVADAYAGVNKAISGYNDSVRNELGEISSNVASYFRDNTIARRITESIDFTKKNYGLNINTAKDILQSIGIDRVTIENLRVLYGDRDFANLTTTLGSLTGIELLGDIGTVAKLVKGADLNNLASLIGVFSKLSGLNYTLNALGAIGDTIIFAMDMLNHYGLPVLARKLAEKYKNEQDFKKKLIAQLEQYVSSANLNMIDICIDMIGEANARARCPNAEYQILSAYRLPTDIEETLLPELGTNLIRVCKRFSGSFEQIVLGINGGTTCYGTNLAPFTNASRDSVKVLQAADIYTVEATIGPDYPTYDIYSGTITLYKTTAT